MVRGAHRELMMKTRSPDGVPTEVYLSFVASLFGNRKTLFTGMIVHVVTYAAVYAKSGDAFYIYLTGIFACVCLFRIYWFGRFDRTDKNALSRSDIAEWELRYLYGGVATTTILGIGSGYSIYFLRDSFCELACISVTLASMVSVVGRNYGSSKAVNLQTLSACVPIMIGFLLVGDPYMAVLAVLLVPFLLTTRMMANGVREFLYNYVIASREVSLIADRFDTALNNMPHGLFMVDGNNRIQVANRKACELLHLGNQESLKDCDLDVVLRYGSRHTFVDGSLPSLIQRQLTQLTDGSLSRTLVEFSENLFLEFTASRRPDGVVVLIFEDVTPRIRAERRILHMVRYDPLTGLPNREFFVESVQDWFRRHGGGGRVGFLILDVDEFKHVNDMKGHVTGDRLLCRVADELQRIVGDETIVGRLMGDQFVLFFPDEKGLDLGERIRATHAAICGSYEVDGTTFRVNFSAGYVILGSDEFRQEEWQIKVDLALFEAKSRAKGSCVAFEQEMDARYVERQKLKVDLREAVEKGGLHVVYQPMYRPDGTHIECCEALVRWVHPERGSIPPNVFIQIAEEMGIVSEITRFVLQQACADCASWPDDIGVSVNLSVQDLRNENILSVVADALGRAGLPASRLHLEVTEGSLLDELGVARSVLTHLRGRGVTIAIDDFGTGFSSLSYLDNLPVDVIKIDRSFVRNISEEARGFKLLRGIVHLSRELDLRIVVEGVETEDQLMLLNKYQCADLIQGYVFSVPLPSRSLLGLMEALANKSAATQRQKMIV